MSTSCDPAAFAILILGDAAEPNLVAVPWHLFVIFVAWGALWTQFVLVPFFFKGEKLHQDYYGTGKVNEALSKIESERFIPALQNMFQRIMDSRPNKRKKPNFDEILNEVDVIPDLNNIQAAIADMEKTKLYYAVLPPRAARVWMSALFHVVCSPLVPVGIVFLLPIENWGLWANGTIIGLFSLSLIVLFWQLFAFHRSLAIFTRHLERINDEGV